MILEALVAYIECCRTTGHTTMRLCDLEIAGYAIMDETLQPLITLVRLGELVTFESIHSERTAIMYIKR